MSNDIPLWSEPQPVTRHIGKRWRLLTAGAIVAGLLGPAAVSPSLASAFGCPNEAARAASNLDPATGQPYSEELPECRAYELVSANTEDLEAMPDPMSASGEAAVGAGGNEVAWRVTGEDLYANPPAGAENTVIATRGPEGWLQSNELAPPGYAPGSKSFTLADATPDMSELALEGKASNPHAEGIAGIGPFDYVERTAAGAYETIATDVSSNNGDGDQQVTVSADGTHALLTTLAQLAGDSHTSGHQLYEWTAGGGLRLFAVDSAGNPLSTCGAILGGGTESGAILAVQDLGSNPVSSDGSRVFFTSPDPHTLCGPGELYVRENDTTTVEISKAPPGAGECAPGLTECPATFAAATPDGSKVFFVTRSHLTPDKANSDPDLYEYDVDTGALTRLSVGPPGSDDADVPLAQEGGGAEGLPQVLASRDGSHVYFLAGGQLVPGEGTAGRGNLYLYAHGQIRYIATLDFPINSQSSEPVLPSSFVTPDGSDLVFESTAQLTSYDNAGHSEIYRYDAPSGVMSCVSCDPSGAPPGPIVPRMGFSLNSIRGPYDAERAISEDGSTIFFVSADDLVAAATNHEPDVYEWHDGAISLISSGTNPYPDYLLGMSSSGSDVFLMTRDQLLQQDGDEAYDIYDARVAGGVVPPAASAPCASAATCRSAQAFPPAALDLATAAFAGPGNVTASAATPTAPPRVKVSGRWPKGAAPTLSVTAPGPGSLSASGVGLTALKRTVARSGVYTLRISLTAGERRALRRRRHATLKVTLDFRPFSGAPTSATLSLRRTP